jgi:hypothetical protein
MWGRNQMFRRKSKTYNFFYLFEFQFLSCLSRCYFSLVYQETEQLCKVYANTKGPGTQAIPERHQFFKNLGTIINRIAEKCERENGMM